MKRTRRSTPVTPGGSSLCDDDLRHDDLLSSKRKRQALGLLLEELSRPEVDIPAISNHTSTVLAHLAQRNAMVIPVILDLIQKQNAPLVLEITQNVPKPVQDQDNSQEVEEEVVTEAVEYGEEELFKFVAPPPRTPEGDDDDGIAAGGDGENYSSESVAVVERIIPGEMKVFPQHRVFQTMEEHLSSEPVTFTENVNVTAGGKQFEIIFADSTRPSEDMDNEDQQHHHHHIIHSTTERTGTSSEATPGTVNVPNSFPLFQLVHAGEVPEEMQREIEQKIRQANPELDLNSITFKFKPPETVEIIANINT